MGDIEKLVIIGSLLSRAWGPEQDVHSYRISPLNLR
jgi:hypothetical protein